jgi:hypothetical protein
MAAALMTLFVAGIAWLIFQWKKGNKKLAITIWIIIGIWFLLSTDFFRYETAEVGLYDIRRDRYTNAVYIKMSRSAQWKKTGLHSIREAKYLLEQKIIRDSLDR